MWGKDLDTKFVTYRAVYNIYYVPPPKNPGFPSLSPRFVGVIYIYINNFLNISFRRFFLEIKVA